MLHLRSGNEVLAAAIVQGRGLEPGDAPEAMVVGKTFAQHNKTALGLSIPAMLTKDHFPPIIVGGQGFAIVGIYATGDPNTDDQVLVPLATAQQLLNQPGRLSGTYVTPASPATVIRWPMICGARWETPWRWRRLRVASSDPRHRGRWAHCFPICSTACWRASPTAP